MTGTHRQKGDNNGVGICYVRIADWSGGFRHRAGWPRCISIARHHRKAISPAVTVVLGGVKKTCPLKIGLEITCIIMEIVLNKEIQMLKAFMAAIIVALIVVSGMLANTVNNLSNKVDARNNATMEAIANL